MPVIIMQCSCKSEFQDKTYGKGQRVHNVGQKSKANPPMVCTVCGSKK